MSSGLCAVVIFSFLMYVVMSMCMFGEYAGAVWRITRGTMPFAGGEFLEAGLQANGAR
jgi:hypothetical protein